MKFSKIDRHMTVIALMVSAASLMGMFVILSFNKKSFMGALVAIASAQVCAAAFLEEREKFMSLRHSFSHNLNEFFDDDLSEEEAAEAIKQSLSHHADSEPAEESKSTEIPVDNEATEADFH